MTIFEAVKKSAEWIVKKFYERDSNATLSRSKNSQAPARNNASADSGEVQGEMQSQEQVASCGGPEPPDPDDDEDDDSAEDIDLMEKIEEKINKGTDAIQQKHIQSDHHLFDKLGLDHNLRWPIMRKYFSRVIHKGRSVVKDPRAPNNVFWKRLNTKIGEIEVRYEELINGAIRIKTAFIKGPL